jgi:hypothetical protein
VRPAFTGIIARLPSGMLRATSRAFARRAHAYSPLIGTSTLYTNIHAIWLVSPQRGIVLSKKLHLSK